MLNEDFERINEKEKFEYDDEEECEMKGTVTMTLETFDELRYKAREFERLENMLKEAFVPDGEPVLTERLKEYIKEIYC